MSHGSKILMYSPVALEMGPNTTPIRSLTMTLMGFKLSIRVLASLHDRHILSFLGSPCLGSTGFPQGSCGDLHLNELDYTI